MARDSKLWEEAYNGYKKTAHYKKNRLNKDGWLKAVGQGKKRKVRSYEYRSPRSWKSINDEMKVFQKTERFRIWRKNQFLRQGGTCYYCHQPLRGVKQNIEHIIPKSKGGDNRFVNLVIACYSCNREKNTKLLTREEKKALFEVNKKKRGTYHLLKDDLQTDEEFYFELRQRFRED